MVAAAFPRGRPGVLSSVQSPWPCAAHNHRTRLFSIGYAPTRRRPRSCPRGSSASCFSS